MSKMLIHTESCKGCRYCLNSCPTEAISVSYEINKKGYKFVQVDEEKCILCGACHTVCPDCVFEIVE